MNALDLPERQRSIEMADADKAAYEEGLGYTIEEAIAHARDAGGQILGELTGSRS